LGQDYSNFHIFVVDNDSSDDSLAHIEHWCSKPSLGSHWSKLPHVKPMGAGGLAPVTYRTATAGTLALQQPPAGCRVTLLASGGNFGFAGGCNVGLRAAGLDSFSYFWLLNPDTVVQQQALTELVRRAEQSPRNGMTGSTLRYYDSPFMVQAMGGARLDERYAVAQLIGMGRPLSEIPVDPGEVEAQLSYVMGASLLASQAFVRDIGLLQEDYFLYYEEIDWALRGKPRYSLAYAPRSHVFHKSGASTGQLALPSSRYYYRSRMRFAHRFMPARVTAVRFGLVAEMVRHGSRARWAHAKAAGEAVFWSP
jgi:GT2 family glycosyltransferase